MSIRGEGGGIENFSNIDLPISSLYLLAAPSTPPEAVKTVINRAKAGDRR
jgi:hypothetical protein